MRIAQLSFCTMLQSIGRASMTYRTDVHGRAEQHLGHIISTGICGAESIIKWEWVLCCSVQNGTSHSVLDP